MVSGVGALLMMFCHPVACVSISPSGISPLSLWGLAPGSRRVRLEIARRRSGLALLRCGRQAWGALRRLRRALGLGLGLGPSARGRARMRRRGARAGWVSRAAWLRGFLSASADVGGLAFGATGRALSAPSSVLTALLTRREQLLRSGVHMPSPRAFIRVDEFLGVREVLF